MSSISSDALREAIRSRDRNNAAPQAARYYDDILSLYLTYCQLERGGGGGSWCLRARAWRHRDEAAAGGRPGRNYAQSPTPALCSARWHLAPPWQRACV